MRSKDAGSHIVLSAKALENTMTAKPGFENLVDWCKAEIDKLKAELSPLEAGKMHIGSKAPDGDWEDITHKRATWLKEKIVELDDLIIKYSFPI